MDCGWRPLRAVKGLTLLALVLSALLAARPLDVRIAEVEIHQKGPDAIDSGGSTPLNGAFLLSSAHARSLLEDARSHLFAYRLDRADSILYVLAEHEEGGPAAWFHLTMTALHRALMSDEDEYFQSFYARRDTLARLLDRQPRSLWADYMRAETGLWEAVVHAKRGRYVRSAMAARSSFGRFSRIVADEPAFFEAYKGLGLLHLSIGSLPGSFRFLLKVLGYQGGIAQGLNELEQAYTRSRYNSFEAGIFLAFAKVTLYISGQEGLHIVEDIYQRDTSSTLAAHLYGFLLLSDQQAERAAEVLSAAVARSETPAYFYDEYIDFYLAEAHFRNDRFDDAELYYRRYIDRHSGPALKAQANLGLGRALEMQGRRSEALGFYDRVRAQREFDTDAASKRAAERLRQRPIAGIDRELLLAANAYDSRRWERAEELLTEILTNGASSDDEKAEAAYRLGRLEEGRGRYAEAIAAYGQAISLQSDRRARWAPWSWFYIGRIWLSQGLDDQARQAFDHARAYGGGFDYHQALEQSIRAALETSGG